MRKAIEICGRPLSITGRLRRIVRLRDEYHDFVDDPSEFLGRLVAHRPRAGNLFTFIQPVPNRTPRFAYHLEWDAAAVLPLSTYDHWWKKQINDKTRNMVRKARKAGLEIRQVEFSDKLVAGIQEIYNESPIRQGRPFKHFAKPFEVIKREHATFLDRSDFFGAYYSENLVGFIKLVHGNRVSNLMQIISMIAHRDKAPTNALIAKAVECCSSKGVPLLHYGTWSRRSMGEFKKHHAFQCWGVPRYYVPLTAFGRLLLQCRLHRPFIDKVPENWLDQLALWRNKWNAFRYWNFKKHGAVAQLVEPRAQA
jgi:hypothetical protein